MSWFSFRPYVSVAQRQRNAQRELAKLAKKGLKVSPVRIEGRTIAQSFWGQAWCDNLESYMDYANRLPRGQTYVRNGSVVHLEVQPGVIHAKVSGSELYEVKIQITPVPAAKWKTLCQSCAGAIGSLLELLQGRLSDRVMEVITRRQTGLFPSPAEIKMKCSCPDWAGMCKHLAAVLYGVGARLDERPELLFLLRSVDHEELIGQASAATPLQVQASSGPELAESQLSEVFGIELDTEALSSSRPTAGKVVLPSRPPEDPPESAATVIGPTAKPARRGRKAKPLSAARKLTQKMRARIAAAQKARWARLKSAQS